MINPKNESSVPYMLWSLICSSALRMKSFIIGCMASGYRSRHVCPSRGVKKHCASFFCRSSCWTCLLTFHPSFMFLAALMLCGLMFFRFFIPSAPVPLQSYIVTLNKAILSTSDIYQKPEHHMASWPKKPHATRQKILRVSCVRERSGARAEIWTRVVSVAGWCPRPN